MAIKPDYEEYCNGVKIYVWDNNGDPRIKINRKIKGKDGKYRYVDFFRAVDMPNITEALRLVQQYVLATCQGKEQNS